MKTKTFVWMSMSTFTFPSPAAAEDFRLDEELVREIEAQLVLPAEVCPLPDYVRYYAKGTGLEAQYVFGVLIRENGESGIRIVDKVPQWFGGECNIITFRYDTQIQKIDRLFCNADT